MNTKFDIYVSYQYCRTTEAEYLSEQLTNQGLKVWFSPWNLVIGAEWEEAIREALQESKCIMAVIGDTHIYEDKWMKKEVEIALEIKEKSDYPIVKLVLLPNSNIDNIPEELKACEMLDLREGITNNKKLDEFTYSIKPVLEVKEINLRINHFLSRGDYNSVVELLSSEYFRKFEDLAAGDMQEMANLYNHLASAFRGLGRYEEGIHFYQKAFDIIAKINSKLDEIILHNNIAACYSDWQKFEESLLQYKKALEISKQIGSTFQEATVCNNLGTLYKDQQDYLEALRYYGRALEISMEIGDSGLRAITYSNIASIFTESDEHLDAHELLMEALRVNIRDCGYSHQATATIYSNLAGVKYDLRQYDKAIELFTISEEIVSGIFDESHPTLANLYNNKGAVYLETEDYQQAMDCFLKALKIYNKEAYRKPHPKEAYLLNNMAYIYVREKNREKAIEYYQRALDIFYSTLGEGHPDSQLVANNLKQI